MIPATTGPGGVPATVRCLLPGGLGTPCVAGTCAEGLRWPPQLMMSITGQLPLRTCEPAADNSEPDNLSGS